MFDTGLPSLQVALSWSQPAGTLSESEYPDPGGRFRKVRVFERVPSESSSREKLDGDMPSVESTIELPRKQVRWVQFSPNGESLAMLLKGMSPGEIDSCMTLGAGHPMGPLALLDFVGLPLFETRALLRGPLLGEASGADAARDVA